MCNGCLDRSVDMLVVAICTDYFRRKEAIENKSVSRRTEIELRYLNYKVYESCAEIVGERYCERFIEEIGERRGFAYSYFADYWSEGSYKKLKRDAKHNIAKSLHFIDG